MRNHWTELALYESRDLVSKLYKEAHGGEINATKAQQVVSFFAQGREYFAAAERAGDLVRPLLLYYGVTALSRGLILFLTPKMLEGSLDPGHGLSAYQWHEVIASGMGNLGKLQVKVASKGTFAQLARATGNREWCFIGAAPGRRQAFGCSGTEKLPADRVIAFSELCGRLPQLAEVYEETYQTLPPCYRASVFRLSPNTHTDVRIAGTHQRIPSAETLQQQFGFPREFGLRLSEPNAQMPEHHYTLRIAHESVAEMAKALPPVWSGPDGERLVPPIDGDLILSSLSMMYGVSYVLGIMGRYYPTQWLSLVTRQSGDLLYPLLREALSVIEQEFPRRVLTELRFWSVVFGADSGFVSGIVLPPRA
jgi:hypothetical protein